VAIGIRHGVVVVVPRDDVVWGE